MHYCSKQPQKSLASSFRALCFLSTQTMDGVTSAIFIVFRPVSGFEYQAYCKVSLGSEDIAFDERAHDGHCSGGGTIGCNAR